MTKTNWSGATFILLIMLSVVFSIPLINYVFEHPTTSISGIIITLGKVASLGDKRYEHRVEAGAFLSLLLIAALVYCFILIPMQVLGLRFWKFDFLSLKYFLPLSKTAKFYNYYIMAKIAMRLMKREKYEYTFRKLQERAEKYIGIMREIDPQSPLLAKIINRFYHIHTGTIGDTAISSEIKEYEEMGNELIKFKREEDGAKPMISLKRLIFGIVIGVVAVFVLIFLLINTVHFPWWHS